MRRTQILLAAAALCMLSACNAIIGLKEVQETEADAAISCEVNDRYELLQAGDDTQGTSVSVKDGAITFALALNVDSATDFFFLLLKAGVTPGTYSITGADTRFESCTICALLAVNFTGAFDGDDFYVASSGEVRIDSVNGRLMATLSNMKFRHVSVSGGMTTNAADGCKSEIQSVIINKSLGAGTIDAGVPMPDAGPTTTVTGTVINNQMTENGEVQDPIDASKQTIEALTLDDKFTSYPGTGKADGSFTIVTPPAAVRYIRVGVTYIVTDELSVDFGQTDIGRSDGVRVPEQSAYFAIFLDNVETAKDRDFFEIYVPNLDILAIINADQGQTTLDTSIWTNPIIEQGKNDRVYLTQLAGRETQGGDHYLTLSRIYALPLFSTFKDDTTSLPNASFMNVDPVFNATLEWRRKDFQAQAPLVNPGAVLNNDGLSVSAVPYGPRVDLQLGNAVDLFYVSRSDAADVNFGAVPLGFPFPASWEKWIDHRSIFNVPFKANGAGDTIDFRAAILRFDPLSALDGQPIRPGVLPVRNPQINGASAFAPQTGVGATPVVSFTAPDGPTPTGYRVALYELYNDGGSSNFKFVSQVFTTGLSVRYPPGWLVLGRTYFFRITSILAPSSQPKRAPYRRGLPTAEADTVSSIVTP